jgi:hypothetical protein
VRIHELGKGEVLVAPSSWEMVTVLSVCAVFGNEVSGADCLSWTSVEGRLTMPQTRGWSSNGKAAVKAVMEERRMSCFDNILFSLESCLEVVVIILKD